MILCVIPARGGSKGLLKKNIRPLLGKPVIGYTIEAAQNEKILDRYLGINILKLGDYIDLTKIKIK